MADRADDQPRTRAPWIRFLLAAVVSAALWGLLFLIVWWVLG